MTLSPCFTEEETERLNDLPEVKQLGSGRAENWARCWGFKQESVPSVGLQSSWGQEGVKREAIEPGNAMKEGIVQGTLES